MDRLWAKLEGRLLTGQPRKAWEDDLGDEFRSALKYLRRTDELMESYPCPSSGGDGCPRQVIDRGQGKFVAVCGDRPIRCDALELERSDLLILEFDLSRLFQDITDALGAVALPKTEEFARLAWRFSTVQGSTAEWLSVFLAVAEASGDLHRVVTGLVAQEASPFVLVTFCRSRVEGQTSDLMKRRSSVLLALDDGWSLDSDERLVAPKLLPRLLLQHQDSFEGGCRFEQQQETWLIAYGGRSVRLKHLKGLLYIRELLRCPGRSMSAMELKEAAGQGGARSSSTQFRQQCNSSFGLDLKIGIPEKNFKRANDAVGVAIQRALEKIAENHSALGSHLTELLSRGGGEWRYQQDRSLSWIL